MKIFVTGGTGFRDKHLVKKLIDEYTEIISKFRDNIKNNQPLTIFGMEYEKRFCSG